MKSFFIKVFMMVAAGLCMFEGLVLVAVGLGKVPTDKLVNFYNGLLATPRSLTTLSLIGAFFVTLGFILLIFSARTRPAPHVIDVEKDGKPLSIPEKAVRSFILQIIEQSPCASDVSIEFEHTNKKDVEILIAIGLDGVSSIYEELDEIEKVIKSELERVFEWTGFKITFQLRGVGVDKTKKYFVNAKLQEPVAAEEKAVTVDENAKIGSLEEPLKDDGLDLQTAAPEISVEEEPADESKDKSQKGSLLTKMLFGGHKVR